MAIAAMIAWVVTASIGIRGQGNALKRGFAKLKNVEIKTLCDIDANLAPERINTIIDFCRRQAVRREIRGQRTREKRRGPGRTRRLARLR